MAGGAVSRATPCLLRGGANCSSSRTFEGRWIPFRTADAAFAAHGVNSCAVEAEHVQFGIYDPTIGQPTDTTGSAKLSRDCEGNGCGAVHYSIAIGGGNGTGSNRTMERNGTGAAELRYDLYTDANRSVPWGSGESVVGGMFQPSHFGQTIQATIFARMPPSQNAGPRRHTDIAPVVVTF